ncbi:MAG: ESPR domain-containing protein, partial [Gammaproteobacteria bacterium]
MNHIYRLVFNRAKGVIQVTSELGSTQGKASSASGTGGVHSARRKKIPSLSPLAAAITLALLMLQPGISAHAATTLTSKTGSAGTNGSTGSSGANGTSTSLTGGNGTSGGNGTNGGLGYTISGTGSYQLNGSIIGGAGGSGGLGGAGGSGFAGTNGAASNYTNSGSGSAGTYYNAD